MELLNYDVSLLVFHPTMSIDDISETLEQKPTEFHSPRNNDKPWCFRFDPTIGLPLAECIENIAESISGKRALFDKLYRSGGTIILSVGCFVDNDIVWFLAEDQMSRLINSHVNVRIHIYPPDTNYAGEPADGGKLGDRSSF